MRNQAEKNENYSLLLLRLNGFGYKKNIIERQKILNGFFWGFHDHFIIVILIIWLPKKEQKEFSDHLTLHR